MDEHFGISEKNSSVGTEFRAGLAGFFVIASIMITNASILERLGSASYSAAYFASGISAALFTLLMGLVANLPVVAASSSGVTGFLVYSVCINSGFTYANAMLIVLLEGIVFTVLTATGLRKRIFAVVPECVRVVIPAAMGIYLVHIGLKTSGILVSSDNMASSVASFNILSDINGWAWIMPRLTAVLALVLMVILAVKQVSGAVIWGIVFGTVLYYLFGITIPEVYSSLNLNFNPGGLVSAWLGDSFLKVFTEGFDFTHYFEAGTGAGLFFVLISSVIAVFAMDFLQCYGVLCCAGGIVEQSGESGEESAEGINTKGTGESGTIGNIVGYDDAVYDFETNARMEKGMMAAGIGVLLGSIIGASSVSPVPHSAAGMAEGGRTGLSSVFTSVFLFAAAFFSPLSTLIPGAAAGAAAAFAGIMLIAPLFGIFKGVAGGSAEGEQGSRGISAGEMQYPEFAIPAAVTLAAVPLSGSVSAGIFAGLASYTLAMLFTGNSDRLRASMWIVVLLYLFAFLFTN